MTYRLLRFYRRFPVHTIVLALFLVTLFLCAVMGDRRSLAVTSSLCIAATLMGAFRMQGRLKVLLREARITGRDLSLVRVMATASRQPFFFCCPLYGANGNLQKLSVRFVNRAACRAFGFSGRRLRQMSFCQLIDPVSHSTLLREATAGLRGLPSNDFQLVFLPKNGQLERYEVRLLPLAGGIAITTLHSREEEMAHQRADAADQFTQSVFDSAPVSIIATDAQGTIVAVNSAAEQLTLYRSYELVGVHSILVLHDASELSARAVELSETTDRTVSAGFDSLVGAPGATAVDKEWTYVRRDGSRTWVSLTMSPLKDPKGDIGGYLAIAFDVSERRRLTEATTHMAHHDQLTQLANRSQLKANIERNMNRALRLNTGVSLFIVDIDHFKRMNDSLGHAGGDTVLVTVADRLLASVRASDTVIRVGGDEFVIIMPDMSSEEDAERRAQLILDDISKPFFVGSREVRITASIGYCLAKDTPLSAECFLRRSDLAMYAAKAAGRNAFRAYTDELRQETADRLEMEEDLRHAIERGELALHYQPQVRCAGRDVEGIEMLLRWKNPKRGNVPPDVFIPIAEDAGLMSDIGKWALRRACVDCMAAQAAVGQRLRVAVNLSAREFSNAGLPTIVNEALAASGLPPEDLELEITEQVLMSATPCLLKTLAQLRALGISLAIDDFGTGFSNFSYILQYQVDRLKIDRSFISRVPNDPGGAAIVRTVIAMAHGLGMKVCAEGVETGEQLAFLGRRRCDEIQGYYFSKAVPLSELADVIRSIQAKPTRLRRPPHRAVALPHKALVAASSV